MRALIFKLSIVYYGIMSFKPFYFFQLRPTARIISFTQFNEFKSSIDKNHKPDIIRDKNDEIFFSIYNS